MVNKGKVAKGIGTFLLVKRVMRLGFGVATLVAIAKVLGGRDRS
jgi:hypothetical protein